jgi:class II aldolase/adducin N-terminal domain-containing protein
MHTVRDKSEYHRQTSERMERHFVVPDWSVRQKLALACRMLAMDGHDSGLAGQLSARANRPGAYYMLRFGLGLEEATPDNLLLVDDDLNVLEGDGMPNPSDLPGKAAGEFDHAHAPALRLGAVDDRRAARRRAHGHNPPPR